MLALVQLTHGPADWEINSNKAYHLTVILMLGGSLLGRSLFVDSLLVGSFLAESLLKAIFLSRALR